MKLTVKTRSQFLLGFIKTSLSHLIKKGLQVIQGILGPGILVDNERIVVFLLEMKK
uniref:Uncharacterized protein n=1 Tax=Anguilla anguilla TaxID=7936 RepID=A0A0E9TDN6_ANGAN